MIYDNSQVRRQDRLLDKQMAENLLKNSEYGILSVIDENGLPYGVPVNFVFNGNNSIYIHCAMEGKKINALKNNPNISFCIVGNVNLLSNKFTTEYESIIIQGVVDMNIKDEEKLLAIDLILQKFAPNDIEIGRKYATKSFTRTKIIRIDINKWSGKQKKVL